MASSTTRSLLVLIGAIVLAVACSTGAPGPRIDSVTPPYARTSSTFQLTISGKNFYRKVVPDAGNPSSSKSSDVRVVLSNATTAFGLALSSSMTATELSGTIDAGHAAGPYDVTVFADGGSYTAHGALTLNFPPVAFAFSSATEALPGTSDVVTLSATVLDAGGASTTPDAPLNCSVTNSGNFGATIPPTITIGTTQTSAQIVISDKLPESFSVGCGPVAPLVLTTGSATFIVGPPKALKVLDAAAASAGGPIASGVYVEDADGNAVSSHPAYNVALSNAFASGTICSPAIPASAVIGTSSSTGTISASGGNCFGTVTFTVTPSLAGLIGSSGLFSWP